MTKVDPDENQSQWVSLLSVADVDEAVRVTRDAGGEIHVGPKTLGGIGRLAVVSDPQGAVVSFLRVASGDRPDEKAQIGDWMWTELWTGDVEASSEFYRKLVGYDLQTETILDDLEYVIFARGDDPRAGVIPRPVETVRAHWLPYVRVEDPAALAAKVEGLGGFVLLDPREDVRKGTVAVVLDPTGAAIALQQWEEGA
jgi:predicted enzyme related to lactoylglutathione lyase